MALSPEALAAIEKQRAKAAAQKGGAAAPQATKPAVAAADFSRFTDMVPNLDKNLAADAAPTVEQDAEVLLDQFIDRLSFKEAYEKFCGKGPIKWSNADENNMIRCPRPDHEDKKPSAWFKISTKVWMCACEDGGGIIDLVGATMGILGVQDRKGKHYHDIRRHIAKSYGWTVYKRSDGTLAVVPPGAGTAAPKSGGAFGKLLQRSEAVTVQTDPQPRIEPEVTAAPDASGEAQVLQLVQPDAAEEPDDDDGTEGVSDIPWREVFAEESFVRAYMDATSQDDSPEMYHLWSALVALGMTTGRDVTLWDSPMVYGNLSICLLGHTGQGKSRSRGPLIKLLDEMMPYDKEEQIPEGAAQVINPKTGEGLTDAFARPIRLKDPKTGQMTVAYPGRVKGVAMFEEFSEIVSLIGRPGSTLDTVIMAGCDCGNAKMGGTTKGDGMFVADEHYMSAWSSTQPNRLQDLFKSSDKESGFLNRWVFVAGTAKPRSTFNHGPSADLTRAMHHYLIMRNEVRAKGQYAYELMPDAMEEFDSFIQGTVLPEMDKGSPMVQRMNLIMKKLLLLLAVNARVDKVTVDIVRQAKAFYPYLLDTYALIDRNIGLPTKGETEEYILTVIKRYQENPKKSPKKPEFITPGDLWDKIRRNRLCENNGREVMIKAIEVLEKLQLIERIDHKPGMPGKPTEYYKALA